MPTPALSSFLEIGRPAVHIATAVRSRPGGCWRESNTDTMAELPSHLHLVYHTHQPYPQQIPLDEVYTDLEFPAGTATRPFVYLNMVETFDGQAVLGGSAWTIGTDVDHYLFRQLRVHADAVLYGAGTLRADDVVVTTLPAGQQRRVQRGLPPNPPAIVVTATCRFSDHVLAKKFFRRTDFQRVIITTPRATPSDVERVQAAGVRVQVVAARKDGEVDLEAALHHLAATGARRVLCEGGPTLTAGLARAGLLDELFVTVSPRLGGDPAAAHLIAGPVTDRPLEMVSEYHYRASPGVREIYFRFRYPR
jgi:riboflavin biosynthesis pyrimidine reductase